MDDTGYYKTLFDQSADAYLILENEQIVDCNPAAVAMLGYDSPEEILYRHPASLSPTLQSDGQESLAKGDKMIALVLEKGSHSFEWNHMRKNGEVFDVEVLLTLMAYKDRQFIHVVWRDLTEKKRAEQILQRTQKMNAIAQLTGGIAHDFNNILNIALGNVDLLRLEVEPTESTKKRLGAIDRSLERAANLCRKLLSFARNDPHESSVYSINAIVLGMEELITRSITPGVQVSLELGDDVWQVKIDASDFEDALLNLAINARDAMDGNGILSITTSNTHLDAAYCRRSDNLQPGDYVEVAISDTGTGVPSEVQERIFEPFFTTKEVNKGTGLGLAMVYSFVKRSGGSMHLQSEPSHGTTFHLFFPRSECNPEPVPAADETRPSDVAATGRILVVDDEQESLELAEEYLSNKGFEVFTAIDASGALDLLRKEDIDLLLSDIVMPGVMSGYELAEKAARDYPDLHILLCSAFDDEHSPTPVPQEYSSRLLQKPYRLTELLERITRALAD